MTQENLLPENDRSRPRYQPPAVGSFPSGSVTSPSQPATSPTRPNDWPAPDPNPGTYAPPVTSGSTFDMSAPPVPPAAPWEATSQQGPRTDNFYRYERYSNTPYQPQPPDPQAEAYRKASSRVRARMDFQKHLRSYIFVNALLWGIALLTMSPSHPSFWPVWITVFWGIGLFAQYWQISGREDEQRRRMIEEEMRRKHRY